jgi:hypothetical protein
MKSHTTHKTFVAVTTAVIALTMHAAAQQPPQLNTLMAGMSANAKQLRQYSFKQRTETYVGGDMKSAKLDEVHYSTSGERVSIPLNEQGAQAESHRRGPGARLAAKKIAEKKEEMKEYVERLMSLSSRYLSPEPAKLQAAMANAEITTGGGSDQMRITLHNYVKFGDRMTMSFDPATKKPTRTEVHTTMDDGPVAIVLTYDQIHEGPTYPGKISVRADSKQVEVRVFTYDYRL